MQEIFGILLMFVGAATGLPSPDPVVCKFTEKKECYVALRQQLHLQIPLEDVFRLTFTDKTNSTRLILQKKPELIPVLNKHLPGWQFVNDNKTLILTSAERSDSGTYTLQTFDVNGNSKSNYTLQLNIEGRDHSELTPYILGSVCVLLIVLAVVAFYIYNKRKQILTNKEAHFQDGSEIAYGQVTHLPPSRTENRPAQAHDGAVEYATVVTHPSQKNHKNKQDEVQYGELVFNNPAKKDSKTAKEECVYSEVKHGTDSQAVSAQLSL